MQSSVHHTRTVLLIQPRLTESFDVNFIPFGLLFLAAALRRAGYNPRLLDLNIESPEAINAALQDKPLFVGFSVYTGPIIREVLTISAHIRKKHPDITLVWGGPHPTIMPELTVSHPLVDYVCRGEGEPFAVALAGVCVGEGHLRDVPGITYKENGQIISPGPRNYLPGKKLKESLQLDSINVKPYLFLNAGVRCAYVISSRGCPFRCRFCWNVSFQARRYKAWDIERIEEEFQPLIAAGLQKVLLFDSFIGPLSRVQALGEYFRSHGLAWAIEDGCRVDIHGKHEFFKTLSETGCTHVTFGAESGSQRILDMLHKDISVEDLLRSAEERLPYKIGARYQWMVGIPGETPEDVLKTVELMDNLTRINPYTAHSVELYNPYPGCELFEDVCQAGWQPPADLEAWGHNRWEGRYPWQQGHTWFFKSVQYTSFFCGYANLVRYSAYAAKARPLYRLARALLHPFAQLRWRTRFFSFPCEYQIAEWCRRQVEKHYRTS